MYRVVKLSGTFYALEMDDMDAREVEDFVMEGTTVILVDSLYDLEELGIDPDDVEVS